MIFAPSGFGRWVLRQGMMGWDVAAAQIAMKGLIVDGDFGPRTESAARGLQAALQIRADGIIGPQTQLGLCIREAARAEVGRTPEGLLRGLIEGESGGQWACLSPAYPKDGSRDYGPLQENIKPSEAEAKRRAAFDVAARCNTVAVELARTHERFRSAGQVTDARELWRLTVLDYNWPQAAEDIAFGRDTTWLGREQAWIIAEGVQGVRTGWQWATFYIDSKVGYVTAWTPAA